MDEQTKLQRAEDTFDILCCALVENKWKYDEDEENLTIRCGAQGEDLPIEITVKVDAGRQLVLLLSQFSFVIQEDKRLDAGVAICAINNFLVDGSFDYDITTGAVFFRMTNSFWDSQLDEEVFTYMLYCSCQTIDEYNDKLLMLSKGMLSIEQFLAALEE